MTANRYNNTNPMTLTRDGPTNGIRSLLLTFEQRWSKGPHGAELHYVDDELTLET